jgi:NDP-sugar pyrophosphorylase family protein
VPNRDFLRYGGVTLDGDRRVTGFAPRGPAAEGSFHYIGVQLAEASVFDLAPPSQPTNSIGGIYDALITSDAGAVRGYVSGASFFDVGTPADYWRTSQAFGAGDAASPSIGRNPRIAPTARVTRSILWDDVHVDADAVIDECIVTDGVTVPPGAEHRRKILIAGEAVPRFLNLDWQL